MYLQKNKKKKEEEKVRQHLSRGVKGSTIHPSYHIYVIQLKGRLLMLLCFLHNFGVHVQEKT